MRPVHKMLLTVGVVCLTVSLAVGQFPGGGFGRGGQTTNPVTLLANESVKKEIKLTDEQAKKVPEAIWKALGDVLDADQTRRLKQIVLQQRGIQAFADARVQTSLNMSADQKEGVKTALEKYAEEMKGMFKGGGFGKGGKGFGEKMQNLRKETTEKITGLLTAGQKKQWTEMVGDEFKMEFGFGKGKGGFGKGGKKKDTE